MKLHRNARLSVKGRELLVERIEVAGWSLSAAAEAAGISERTARKWLARYRADGSAGLLDRSSAPSVVANRTDERRIEAIAALRRLRFTGAEIAELLDMALSTVSGILTRIGMGKLGRLGLEPAIRYERARPGELIHIDVKKLGRIQGGAGKRVRDGRKQHYTGRRTDPEGRRRNVVGWEYVHIAIDDATRLAYVEVLSDEKGLTAVGFLRRAVKHFAGHGVTVERVITDNGSRTSRPSTPSPAARSACATCARGPTGRAPTAKPNASSAACSPAGPTARSTPPAPNALAPLTAGYGPTTIAAHTALSATSRPSPASTS
jgi:transposase